MKKFLFIYSLIITVSFSFFLALTNPSKSSLVMTFLFLPIPAYFLISLTNPKEVGVPKWSFRVLLTITLLSLSAFLGLTLLNNLNRQNKTTPVFMVSPESQSPSPTPKIDKTGKENQDFTNLIFQESQKR